MRSEYGGGGEREGGEGLRVGCHLEFHYFVGSQIKFYDLHRLSINLG